MVCSLRDIGCSCLRTTAKGPTNYLSCSSCSGHYVNLLLGCTFGLNLATGLGAVLVSSKLLSPAPICYFTEYWALDG